MSILSADTRKLVGRSLLAMLGGYGLAAMFAACLPLWLPRISTMSRADATLIGMMLSFLIFALWILYSYAVRCGIRALALHILLSTPLLLGLWLLEAPQP
ncbi:hypothetical protein [Shewanella litorisediminis]|uniref:Iron uptake protein n=1 Tax=Shewanella litorisediminis TaxID=1173586 RepID=A0ABX7G2Q2_9GAMM|nr:hypothetical protein [Shewanella litorisediminis]MCL2917145.1 hypothetical protein [Shewanella litorisediminis]QRH01622.1 hypothetical protein JQC75_17535 [Shewanella litorisediminis]